MEISQWRVVRQPQMPPSCDLPGASSRHEDREVVVEVVVAVAHPRAIDDHHGVEPHQRSDPHNPMLDSKGRVWMTSTIQGRNNPDWCREGSDHPSAKNFPMARTGRQAPHPSAKNFPMARTGRQASYYDPEREVFILIYTCFGTHHLQFAEDDDEPLYFSGGGDVIGWINTRVYDETGDERFSQGWCPGVLDTNGDGKASKPWNEPGEPVDPSRDTRVRAGGYGIIPPDRQLRLGEPDRAVPGSTRPARSRRQPAGDLYGRGL